MELTISELATQTWSDDEVINRVLAGESQCFELLVRRYNQRVYRAVRAVLGNGAEAEDVMQEAHFSAYRHLAEFEGRAAYATWLTKIAVRLAILHAKKDSRFDVRDFAEEELPYPLKENAMNPEAVSASSETREVLEQAILTLPPQYRVVVMMRDVEEMSTQETAIALDLSEEAVKVRLHRARAMLRRELFSMVGATSTSAFEFGASRCDRVTAAVMRRVLDGPAN